MFQSARLKLTLWYMVIIMVITGLFSAAFYQASTREIERIIERNRLDQVLESSGVLPPISYRRNAPTIEELEDIKTRSQMTLLIFDGFIVALAGGLGYFLAGKTLRPIQVMLEEQNQFVSDASHELRTPLATLRAEMEGSLLEKKLTDQTARALIRSNLEEITTLQELTDGLLQLTEDPTLRSPDRLAETSVLDLVKSAEKKVAPLLKKKQISLVSNIPDIALRVHKARLVEALVILFDNAIKYSPEKSSITVTATQSRQQVKIDIKDEGIGIASEDVPHIFTRFYRADKSRSHSDGYGLGLSIAKNIIAAHHGTIAVTSELQKGSVFTITLPPSTT